MNRPNRADSQSENVKMSFLMEDSPSEPDFGNPYHSKGNEDEDLVFSSRHGIGVKQTASAYFMSMTAEQYALWKWANIENFDKFLVQVYSYYCYGGIWNLIISRAVKLLMFAFVSAFTVFLRSCIDYSMIAPDKELSQIVRKQCFAKMSTAETTIVFVISMLWIMYFFYCFFELKEYRDTYYFYRYLLQIDEDDLQSLNWEQVTDRIMQLRISNAATANAMRSQRFPSLPIEKMNAHDIANRIMRKENYIIALINNEVLNFKLQIIGNRRHLTKVLEFIISIAIFDHFFDASGYIKPEHISSKNRKKSIENLKTRILLSGLFLLVCSPFVIGSFALYYFLRYSSEYHQNPGALGSRRYTSYALWLFREYNELPHYFEQRLRRSYYPASKYQSQFRNEPLNQLYRLASFIVGSFLVVLVVGSIIDSEVFTKFEITKNRPASFYILLFGAIYTYCRASIKDKQDATESENLMQEIANLTHYFPDSWKSKLSSNSVRNEFLMLYDLNVSIVFWEIASVVLAPFILWMNFMPNASKIVDFFRQNTTHVEGIGYACSFACFETKKQSNPSTESLQNHNRKMESSYISFQNANPNWHPRNLRMELIKYAGNQNSFDQSFF